MIPLSVLHRSSRFSLKHRHERLQEMSTYDVIKVLAKGWIAFLVCSLAICNAGHSIAAPLKGGIQQSVPITEIGPDTSAKPLSGRMQFAETVEPVDKAFQPNKLFAEASLPGEATSDGWYPIPEWRAGKFHRETQTNHSIFGDVTIKSSVDHVYGMQLDKRGGIWHHESWPKVTKVELEDYTEYKIVNSYQPVSVTNGEFVVKTLETDIDVDRKTGKIKQATRQQGYYQYRPCSPDVACAECETLGFSKFGRVNTEKERSSLEETRVEPFRVINSFRGVNLREGFIRYLKSHGLEDLAPDP